MASAINEVDIDYEVQIREIRRLISSTTDYDRREMLEEQLRDLEVARAQSEIHSSMGVGNAPPRMNERRKSFRPSSAKPRMPLVPLAEDKEVIVSNTQVRDLDSYRTESTALVLDVLGTSYDESHAPLNILQPDHHTFWMSTGMFPQLLRLTLGAPTLITRVELMFRNICTFHLHTASNHRTPQKRFQSFEFSSSNDPEQLTRHGFPLSSEGAIEMIDIEIDKGSSDFIVIYWIRLILDEEIES